MRGKFESLRHDSHANRDDFKPNSDNRKRHSAGCAVKGDLNFVGSFRPRAWMSRSPTIFESVETYGGRKAILGMRIGVAVAEERRLFLMSEVGGRMAFKPRNHWSFGSRS